jgi:hypothetical protein
VSYEDNEFDDLYGGSFFKAEHVKPPIKLRVAKCDKTELTGKDNNKRTKFVLHFTDSAKQLPLNKTNALIMAEALGKHRSKWPGAIVELSVRDTDMGEGVAVAVIAPGKPNPDDDLNDDIVI